MGKSGSESRPDTSKIKKTTEKASDLITTQFNDLQQRIEDYSEETPWVPAWKARLKRFFSHDVGLTSAASSFYLLFSLFPMTMFIFNLLDLLNSDLAAKFAAIIPQLDVVIPQEILQMIQNFLEGIGETSSIPLLSGFGIILLWAASRGIGSIVTSMSKIYHSDSKDNFLFRRLVGIIGIFISVVLLIVIMLFLTFNRLVISSLREFIVLPKFIKQDRFNIFATIAAFIVLTIIFMIIFTFVKRQRSYFRHTLISAMITSLGWIITTRIMSIFISHTRRFYIMYGSITNIIFLMLWMYAAIYILMVGAFVHAEFIRKFPRPEKERKFSLFKRKKKAKSDDTEDEAVSETES